MPTTQYGDEIAYNAILDGEPRPDPDNEYYGDPDGIPIDDWVETLSEERKTVLACRAAQAMGRDVDDWPMPEEPLYVVFEAEFSKQLQLAAAADLVHGLERRGEIEANGLGEDGSVMWIPTAQV